jgi:LuxR family maltose regulon positive regulatory protein
MKSAHSSPAATRTSKLTSLWDVPAKLAVPVVAHVIARPRLDEMLTAGLECPVTLLAATAGWGKTTLTASWIAAGAGGRVAAWVSLDGADNDPRTFWREVAMALLQVATPEQAGALRAMATESDVDTIAAILASAIRVAEQPVVLVLDNLHEVTSPLVHAGLLRLVERPLPMLSLLITTRQDPPWPLPRLRVAGLLATVRTEDLAFRVDEAMALFAQLKVDLRASQVAQLVTRSEGWPAGLRLAALRLRDVADVDAAISAFSGNDHPVAEYLVSEVLDQQAPELMEFLQKISTVEFVCADLANALTDRLDSAQLLADLAASHLFVHAIDRPGQWYRLHRLIADVLRARPSTQRNRRDLHRRAAEWFRQQEMPLAAIAAAVAGKLWGLAADLVGNNLLLLVMNGQAADLEKVLSAVPRTTLRADPDLAIGLAGARVIRGDETDVTVLIAAARAAKEALRGRRAERAQVLIDLVAGALARVQGDWTAAALVHRAVPVDPGKLAGLGIAGAETVPVIISNSLGTAAFWRGDLVTAEDRLRAAAHTDLPARLLAQLNAAAHLALLRAEKGELDGAEADAAEVISAASAAGFATTPQVVAAYLAMARLTLDRGLPDEADDWLARVAEVVSIDQEPHIRLAAALLLAARREDAGDREHALAGLRATTARTRQWKPPPALRDQWITSEAALVARLGDPATAHRLLGELRSPVTGPGLLGAGRVLLSLGEAAEARAVRARIGDAGHVRAQVELALLDARLAMAAGDDETALAEMESALACAAVWGLRRPFLVDETELPALLERRIERGTVAPSFALDLLERASGTSTVDGSPASALVDPLTSRERTVLRYLASSLSNVEIAAELYLSVNTVKTHQRAVHRKLGARNRREAVRLARSLNLL